MRTLLGGEFALAIGGDNAVDIYLKLEVQNGSGTWIDVGAAAGKAWIINATWGEAIDSPVSQATFSLVQAVGSSSLAPLMSASLLNRLDDGTTYSPLLDIGRLVRASTAVMPIGVALDVTKYRRIFDGRIDSVDTVDALDAIGPATIVCSDLGGWLMDRQVETDGVQYGTTPVGTALETVIQNILTATLPGGEPAVTLVKQSASSFAVTNYILGLSKVLEALTALVLDTTGEDLRYRYDASHVSQLTWFNPDRTRVTVDQTFTKNQYILRKLDLQLANIRNAGAMPWSDPVLVTSGTVTSTASGSISKYRRRFFAVPASPMLATQAATQAVLDAIVSDLSVPPGEATADLPYSWFVQLYDRYTFAANGVQYDQDQTFGVIGFQHSIVSGQGSTSLTLAGKILGAYAAWLSKISGIGGTSGNAPVPKITLAAQNPIFITAQFDAVVDVDQRPVAWQYRLVGDVTGYSPAFSAKSYAALPVQAQFVRSTFKQASIELKITQADGTTATTSFHVQGQVTPAINGPGRITEDDARSGTGGVPVSRSRIRGDVVYTDDGTTPLIDTLTGRFQTALKGPTGIGGDIIERGGNKGDNGLDGSYKLQTGVTAGATGADGHSGIDSRRQSARQAGHAATGISLEGDTRGGRGGVPIASQDYLTQPYYDVLGVEPLIDPNTKKMLSGLGIGTGVRGESDVAFKNGSGATSFVPNRHNEDVSGIQGDVKTFGVSFDTIPNIRVMPQKWTLPGTDSTANRLMELRPINVTVSTAEIRAVYSTGASTAAKTELFSATQGGGTAAEETGINLTTSGTAAYARLTNANTTLTTYNVEFDVDTTGLPGTKSLVVSAYVNSSVGGTSWTLVGSNIYGSGQTLSDEIIQFNAALAVNWDIRIVVTYSGPGAGTATTTCEIIRYDKVTAGTEVSMAGAGSNILVQATEAS